MDSWEDWRDEHLTEREMLRDLRTWSRQVNHRIDEVKTQTTLTNERVTKLERFQYLIIGGLAVVVAVVVPVFLDMVSG